jgi:hypothetical protein
VSEAFKPRLDEAVHNLELCKTQKDGQGNDIPILTESNKKIYETPELIFDDSIMSSANEALNTILTLKNQGVPISMQTLIDISKSGINIQDELARLSDEVKDVKDKGLDDVVDMSNADDKKDSGADDDSEVESPLDKRNF